MLQVNFLGGWGERQIINAKHTLKFKSDHVDELFMMMQKSKAGDSYMQDIKSSPDPAIVIASDVQLDDLVRFCASSAGVETCIMTVHPTFCLGKFECTPITYRHLLVVTQRNKCPLCSLDRFSSTTGRIFA